MPPNTPLAAAAAALGTSRGSITHGRRLGSGSMKNGEGIDHGSYDPYDAIRDPALSRFERTGVSIAILHYPDCAIDNSTYQRAVEDQGPLLRAVLSDGLLDFQPLVRSAAEAFLETESSFLHALRQVFEELVRPEARTPPDE